MKRIKQITAFAVMMMFVICAGVFAQTGQNCELVLSSCPEDFADSTIIVPPNVISISANIRACAINEVFTDTSRVGDTPPAIVFIIDHSGSMAGTSGHDRLGNRFRITRALIDSIYAVYPEAEVGIVAFDQGLSFDVRRDSNLVRFQGTTTGGIANQGYMPLRRLNAPARRGGGNQSGQQGPFYPASRQPDPNIIDVYRAMFNIPASAIQEATITGGPGTGSGTNIAVAFKAALETFANTEIPKENHYIIFLSDGEPNPRTCARTAAANDPCWNIYDFMYGPDIDNTPATYTVFLNRLVGGLSQQEAIDQHLPLILGNVPSIPWGTPLAPSNLTAARTVDSTLYQVLRMTNPQTVPGMTYAIRNSSYSETNKTSDIWVVESNFEEILELAMNNFVTQMLTKADDGAPTRLRVTNAIVTDSTAYVPGTGSVGSFSFSRPLGLNVGDTTTIEMAMTYRVKIVETITTDGVERDTVLFDGDSTRVFSFDIVRSENGVMPGAGAGYRVENCKSAPTLRLEHNGTAVETVKPHMTTLRVVFDQGDNRYNDQGVTVLVMNTEGEVLDTVTLPLVRNGNLWSADFSRVISDQINTGNTTLEHAAKDSIVLVFRNPYVPLDTARIAIPFVSTEIGFYDRAGDPAGLTAFPDTINVTAGFPTDIFAKFFDPDNNWLPEFETNSDLTSKITWTTNSPQNVQITQNGNYTTFTSTAAGTGDNVYSVTATYRDGGELYTRTIYIKLDPITAAIYREPGDPAGKTPLTEGGTGMLADTLVAGAALDLFAKLFELDNTWIAAYENNPDLAANIKWSVTQPTGGNATLSDSTGISTTFRATAAHMTYTVTARLDLPGFTTSTTVRLRVDPAAGKSLDIVTDTTRIVRDTTGGNNREVELDKSNPTIQVWAIERDEFGNFVRINPNPNWTVQNPNDTSRVNIIVQNDGSAVIERGTGAGDLKVMVNGINEQGQVLTPGDQPVAVIGESSIAVGPNPFIPGRSTLGQLPQRTYDYYEAIITANRAGPGTSGILIAVETPRAMKDQRLRVVIYDAVGNVVLSTTTRGKHPDNNTYGFIWDGKNSRGRAVGPGTYLVMMTGVQESDGRKFSPKPQKIGVQKGR
ncbi:MAG: hypothetical protein FWE57_02255 [Chitinispirillia bacterium]|nr:hypothetical protein [Chitinispirillia bacterium]